MESQIVRQISSRHTSLEPLLRVFLSYVVSETGEDGDSSVQRITKLLSTFRIEAYVAEDKLKGGADFPEEIGKSIKSCDVFIAVLSPSYGTRKWCKRELNMADQYEKVIIPILHSGPYPPKEEGLHLTISQLQFVDFRKVGENPTSDVLIQEAVNTLKTALHNRTAHFKPSIATLLRRKTEIEEQKNDGSAQSKTIKFQCKLELTDLDGEKHLARGEFDTLQDVFNRMNLFFKREVKDVMLKYKDEQDEYMRIDCKSDFQLYKSLCVKSGEIGKIYITEYLISSKVGAWGSLVKVAIMGPGAVGKSAIVIRFLYGRYAEEYDPTIEDSYRFDQRAKFKNYTGHAFDNEKQSWRCNIQDTAGQDDFSALRPEWYRNNHGFIFVFSADRMSSLDDMSRIVNQMEEFHEGFRPPAIILANKIDLIDSNNQSHQEIVKAGRDFAESKGYPFFEVSAKEDINLDICFERIVKKIQSLRQKSEPTTQSRGCSVL